MRENWKNNTKFGENCYLRTRKLSKMNWFKKLNPWLHSNNKVFEIICIYRSPNLNKNVNYKQLEPLNDVAFTLYKSENIILFEDFSFPNFDKAKQLGYVSS